MQNIIHKKLQAASHKCFVQVSTPNLTEMNRTLRLDSFSNLKTFSNSKTKWIELLDDEEEVSSSNLNEFKDKISWTLFYFNFKCLNTKWMES